MESAGLDKDVPKMNLVLRPEDVFEADLVCPLMKTFWRQIMMNLLKNIVNALNQDL